MLVRFIAHAGFSFEEDGFSVLVDPWFTDSSLVHPILEGIAGTRTMDYQIPRTREKIEDYVPHAILISHFHVHHSPLADILQLVQQSLHDTLLAYQAGPGDAVIRRNLSGFSHLSFRPVKDRESFKVGPFTLTPYLHTLPDHLAWLVESATGRVLHLADSRIHTRIGVSDLDPVWDAFPEGVDLLLMSAGRNSLARSIEGQRRLLENTTFSPLQAARLAEKLRPRALASMGNQNHSVWKNRQEFIPEAAGTEEELRWALGWLLPDTKFITIRPGHTFDIDSGKRPAPPADTLL